jgi:hypothetical protein
MEMIKILTFSDDDRHLGVQYKINNPPMKQIIT